MTTRSPLSNVARKTSLAPPVCFSGPGVPDAGARLAANTSARATTAARRSESRHPRHGPNVDLRFPFRSPLRITVRRSFSPRSSLRPLASAHRPLARRSEPRPSESVDFSRYLAVAAGFHLRATRKAREVPCQRGAPRPKGRDYREDRQTHPSDSRLLIRQRKYLGLSRASFSLQPHRTAPEARPSRQNPGRFGSPPRLGRRGCGRSAARCSVPIRSPPLSRLAPRPR